MAALTGELCRRTDSPLCRGAMSTNQALCHFIGAVAHIADTAPEFPFPSLTVDMIISAKHGADSR